MDRLNIVLTDTIADVCEELRIPKPKVRFVDGFGEDNSLAMMHIEQREKKCTYEILIPYGTKFDIATIFNVVHELRHEYQHCYSKFDFSKHKSAIEFSTHDYCMQPEEIDSNAYACGYVYDMFDVQFVYSGWNDEIKQAIAKRMIEIYREMD